MGLTLLGQFRASVVRQATPPEAEGSAFVPFAGAVWDKGMRTGPVAFGCPRARRGCSVPAGPRRHNDADPPSIGMKT